MHGRAGVYVVDGSGVTRSNIAEAKPHRALSIYDIRMHVLSAGDTFDLVARRQQGLPEAEVTDDLPAVAEARARAGETPLASAEAH